MKMFSKKTSKGWSFAYLLEMNFLEVQIKDLIQFYQVFIIYVLKCFQNDFNIPNTSHAFIYISDKCHTGADGWSEVIQRNCLIVSGFLERIAILHRMHSNCSLVNPVSWINNFLNCNIYVIMSMTPVYFRFLPINIMYLLTISFW
jgi:hypothetical protein